MLPKLLADYLDRIEKAIVTLNDVYIERYEEEILTPQRVNLRVRVRFIKGHLLEINEAIVAEIDGLRWLDYRYHYQDEKNSLIFRYDSTPHFPDLPSFPHHKHLPEEVIASSKPDLFKVIKEANNV